jgi:hypothetical protein
MHFPSAPILKSAVVYGLLAAARAIPTPIAREDEKRRSLDLRMAPVRPLSPKPAAKSPPGRPDGPDGAPPPRMGMDPDVPGSGDDVRMDGKPKKDGDPQKDGESKKDEPPPRDIAKSVIVTSRRLMQSLRKTLPLPRISKTRIP